MEDIYVDTIKMREKGKEILNEVESLKTVIDALFERISNIPVGTEEWVGERAQEYVSITLKDKPTFVAYANDLYKYGKYLIDCADYLDKKLATIRRDNE